MYASPSPFTVAYLAHLDSLSSYIFVVCLTSACYSGKTKDGSWIFVERVGLVDPKSLMKNIPMDTLLTFHIYVMEGHEQRRRQQYRKMGWSSPMVIIQDFKGLGWKHAYKPAIDFVGKLSRV
jgi:hypothetical protein